MREYIRRTERAAVMLFRRGSDADYARLDAIDAHNHGIAIRVYNGIMDGSTSYAYIRECKRLIVYTRIRLEDLGPHGNARRKGCVPSGAGDA